MSRYELLHGDCLEKLRALADNSVDAVVTDPPAGIAFMGRDWDKDKGGRREWISWLASIMSECLRVLKPGGHAFVWALPRTSHWTATALEDAGFEVRECCVHIFGSGFPKSHNISKAIDALKGAERPVLGPHPNPGSTKPRTSMGDGCQPSPMLTAPATPEAAQWDGFGTALKPASEHWWLCRKPLIGTVAQNVLEHGTGALNIDGCRVGDAGDTKKGTFPNKPSVTAYGNGLNGACEITAINAGRWPPNVLFSHLPECRQVGTKRVKGHKGYPNGPGGNKNRSVPIASENADWAVTPHAGHADPDGLETVEAWECADGCAVKELDRQSGTSRSIGKAHFTPRTVYGADAAGYDITGKEIGYGDSGGASRFFPTFRYQAKASRREREAGLREAGLREAKAGSLRLRTDAHSERTGNMTSPAANTHPTVKPVDLMRWLVRLVTPPNGVVLDPFTGSGTTGVAALLEGFRFIGCEREGEYFAIAKARLENAVNKAAPQQSFLFEKMRLE